jgi:hypothetical protein
VNAIQTDSDGISIKTIREQRRSYENKRLICTRRVAITTHLHVTLEDDHFWPVNANRLVRTSEEDDRLSIESARTSGTPQRGRPIKASVRESSLPVTGSPP